MPALAGRAAVDGVWGVLLFEQGVETRALWEASEALSELVLQATLDLEKLVNLCLNNMSLH